MLILYVVAIVSINLTSCAQIYDNEYSATTECQNDKRRTRRSIERFNDPMYPAQWYLKGKMNIQKAWDAGYNGEGVVVSVVDTGLQTDHDEFKNNYDPNASYNFVSNTTDPTPTADSAAAHGTKVAGVIAGDVNNSKCGAGIAYKAKIGGIRFIETSGESTVVGKEVSEAKALSFNRNYVDIYTNAWGPDGVIGGSVGYNKSPKTFEDGAKYGRNGKGNIFVFASGNGGFFLDSCTYDGYVTSIYTIAVSAVNPDGNFSIYMERCPAIMAVTYARDTNLALDNTTFPMATAVTGNKCYDLFSGTSAAASVASGIIALVLQANPNLTWRDVQHIITRTANHDPAVVQDRHNATVTNAANFTVSNWFGFGLMDAMAMINLAKNWTTVPQQMKCEYEHSEFQNISSTDPLVNVIPFTNFEYCGLEKLEHVVLTLNMSFFKRRHLQVELISPSKTKSLMLIPRAFLDSFKSEIKMFPTMTLHNWGEAPKGDWTVIFKNSKNGSDKGYVTYYKIELYGTGTPIERNNTNTNNTDTNNKNKKKNSADVLRHAWTLLLVSFLVAILRFVG